MLLTDVDPFRISHHDQQQKCLRYEPADRESAGDLLKHPYFAGMSEWYDTDLRASLDKDRAVNGGAIKPSSPVIDPSLNLALGGGAGNSSSTTQEQHAVAVYAALSPPPTTSTLRSHTDSQAVSYMQR